LIVGLAFVAVIVILMVAGGFLGWRALMRSFVRQYYVDNYDPLPLPAEGMGTYPAEHHLDDMAWISIEEPVCQSTSLQMIAAQRGTDVARSHLDFLMGFSYGATRHPGKLSFYPGTDPEIGFSIAAPYLGLERRYYITDDKARYGDALRYHLSQGYPVRVGLDMALLYGWDDQVPHSEVLVGYDTRGFYYYETVCLPEAPCAAGHRPPGEIGLYVPEEKLFDAVLSQAQLLEYPWRYSLSVFETGVWEQDLRPVWTRNGQSLIGGARYGPPQGADVIKGLADEIQKRAGNLEVVEVRPGLEAAAYLRKENADYLRATFREEADIEEAVRLFEQAAKDYQDVVEILADGIGDQNEANQAAAWLRDAAACEREVGQILIARGR
jgi:hypothetical protein